MRPCPQCQFENPAQMKFCGQCGTRLQLLCASCGAELPPGFRFCGQCGTPLSPMAVNPEAPEVPPTAPTPASPSLPIGGAGAPGSSPSVPSVSPDSIHLPRAPQILGEAVSTGFNETRTERAESEIKQVTVLSAGLRSRTAAGESVGAERLHLLLGRFFELARSEVERFGGTLKPTAGSVLLALFGAPIAHEDHAHRAVLAALALRQRLHDEVDHDQSLQDIRCFVHIGLDTGPLIVGGEGDMAVGEPTEHAGRLRDLALENQILASGRMREMIADHVELVATDSENGSVEAWRVVEGLSDRQEPLRWHGGRLTPFVGREREFALLEELSVQATQGHGQVVGLIGEAGAGKSRMLYEFRRQFRDRRVVYLRGQCLSYGSAVPYSPLIDMIRRSSHIQDGDSPSEVARKTENALKSAGASRAAESLPYLLRLLGIDEGSETVEHLEPLALQNQTFTVMRRMILSASQRQLVVVEIEDLHWIDQTSQDFLNSLVETIPAARVLLIFTYRTGYQPPWTEKTYSTQIPLRRLSEQDSQAIVSAIVEREHLDAGARDVLRKAEGNPLFLEELARTVRERDASSEGSIPNTIQGILMARIDRLPEVHKRLLQTASVTERKFTLELLAALWTEPEPLEPLLEDLQRWELIYTSPSEDQRAYLFKHALIRDVVYHSLLAQRRQSLHRRAAESLEDQYADRLEDAYDRLIYHYPRADQPQKTVHYLRLFADRSARNHTHAEAARALREALEHAENLPESERDRPLTEILLQLAESLLPLAAFPETLQRLERYRDIVESIDDVSLNGRYYFWLAHTHTYLGNQEETRKYAQLAIEAARLASDEATEGKACYVLGRDGFWSGRFTEGIENSLQAVVLLERAGEPWWQGQAYWVAGFNHYVLGDFEESLDALQRAYEIGEALDDHRLDTSWSIGYVHAVMGDAERGVEFCERGLARSQDPLNSAVATGFLGFAYLKAGRLDEAVGQLEMAIAALEETGMLQILGWFSAFLGSAYLEQEKQVEAERSVDRGLTWCERGEFQYGQALVRLTQGEIARRSGDTDLAERATRKAETLFAQLDIDHPLVRTSHILGRA